MKPNSISLEGSAQAIRGQFPDIYDKFREVHLKTAGAVLTEYASSAVSRTRRHSLTIRLDNHTLKLNIDRRVNSSWKTEVVVSQQAVHERLEALLNDKDQRLIPS